MTELIDMHSKINSFIAIFKVGFNVILAEVGANMEVKILMNISFKEELRHAWVTERKVLVCTGELTFVLQERKGNWKSLEIDAQYG